MRAISTRPEQARQKSGGRTIASGYERVGWSDKCGVPVRTGTNVTPRAEPLRIVQP